MYRARAESKNLDTKDIHGEIFNYENFCVGAQPKKMTKENANRPEFLGQNWDISGATCRALHFSNRKYN
jgi:hypothetical protein